MPNEPFYSAEAGWTPSGIAEQERRAAAAKEVKITHRCPQCKGTRLEVTVEVWAELIQTEDGFETDTTTPDDGSHEWTENSPMRCVDCNTCKIAREFQVCETCGTQASVFGCFSECSHPDTALNPPSEICECGRRPDDCATADDPDGQHGGRGGKS